MVTVKKRATRPKLNRQHVFLQVYAETGDLAAAAKGAKVEPGIHYKWLRDDPEFRDGFERARNIGLDQLEAEARRRAYQGDPEPVIYQGGLCYERLPNGKKKQITVTRRSDVLLIFLLKAGRPEKYRDTWKGEVKHTGTISQGPDLSALSDAQLEQLNQMLLLATGGTSLALDGSTGGDSPPGPPED